MRPKGTHIGFRLATNILSKSGGDIGSGGDHSNREFGTHLLGLRLGDLVSTRNRRYEGGWGGGVVGLGVF